MNKTNKPLEGVLKDIVSGIGGRGRLNEEDITKIWERVVGEKASNHTRPVSFNKADLVVNVDGSAWLYELTLEKQKILKKLEEYLKGKKIKDIRFRIGEIK